MTAGQPFTMPKLQPLGECDLWRLVEDWAVDFALPSHGLRGRIEIDAGFVTDGASVPRMAWFLAGHPMESPRVVAALAHDWLYSSHCCNRALADDIYAAILRNVGRAGWRVAVEHFVLRIFGGFAWRATDEKDGAPVWADCGRLSLFTDEGKDKTNAIH